MQKQIFKIFFILALFLTLPIFAFAAPSITSVIPVTTFSHGGVVNISGSGFGTKMQPAPLIWDNGSASSLASAGWSGGWPSAADANSNLRYSPGYRGVAMPHIHDAEYMTGTHAVPTGAGFYGGYDVMAFKTLTNVTYPTTIYLSSYWKVDPAWNSGTDDNNFKLFDFSNGSSPMTTNSSTDANWYASYNGPTDLTNPEWIMNDDGGINSATIIDPDNGGHSHWWDGGASPLNDWVKTEYELKISKASDGYFKVWDNGALVINYAGPTDKYTGTTKTIALGGYAREQDGPTNTRYFSDIYFDTSAQRVLLCAGQAWATRGLCEVQIPQTIWNNGQIQIKVNQGAFADGSKKYLYVVDANGSPSDSTSVLGTQGFPITFSSGSSDAVAPAAPSGLSVQ